MFCQSFDDLPKVKTKPVRCRQFSTDFERVIYRTLQLPKAGSGLGAD